MRMLSVAWALVGLVVLSAAAQADPATQTDAAAVRFEEIHIDNGAAPPLVVGIWRRTSAVSGRAPLVVISHGGAGSDRSHADTAIALAQAGFVAAAVSHAGDTYDDQSHVLELWRRPQQLHRLISYMLEEWPERATLDAGRVGAFGFSNGGFTVLVAAGGTPDLSRIGPYCQAHADHDLCAAMRQAGVDPVHPPIQVPPHAWVADMRKSRRWSWRRPPSDSPSTGLGLQQ